MLLLFHQIGCGFKPWVRKIPWRKVWQPTPVFLPGESHGPKAWRVTVHSVIKSQTHWSNLASMQGKISKSKVSKHQIGYISSGESRYCYLHDCVFLNTEMLLECLTELLCIRETRESGRPGCHQEREITKVTLKKRDAQTEFQSC